MVFAIANYHGNHCPTRGLVFSGAFRKIRRQRNYCLLLASSYSSIKMLCCILEKKFPILKGFSFPQS